jgi:DNA-binding NtrC family response regulator
MTGKTRILVVDDEAAIRESLKDWLMEDGYEVGLAVNGLEAVSIVEEQNWDIILLDLKMPEMDGIEAMEKIKAVSPDSEIIMMTAFATIDTAVKAIKMGAFDYLVKPFDPDEIELQIKKIVSHNELIMENILLRQQLEEKSQYDEIIGKSDAMQEVFDLISRVAPTDSTILVSGESGTGKELVAQAIHGNSKRCYLPFIAVNCGALPETLLESELFGYEKGAFTGAEHTKKGRFEMADNGTLFLDEIGDISLKTQVDLLRVLQNKEFRRVGGHDLIDMDARIITATNRDLQKAIKDKRFREDLYYRLNVISIHLPPLRDRKEDIQLLAKAFVKKFCIEINIERKKIAPSAIKLLETYNWPGNVRELENVIERALVIGRSNEITIEDLPFSQNAPAASLPKALKQMEKVHIENILKENNWNISRTARDLSIDRQTLYNKIEKYGINKEGASK